MNTENLFEKGVMDALKSNLKYQGARARDSALAALGSRKAAGRLSVRTIAQSLIGDFMAYVGGQGIDPITDDVIRDYINRYYPQSATAINPIMQQVLGTQATPQPVPQQTNTQPNGQQSLPLPPPGQQQPPPANQQQQTPPENYIETPGGRLPLGPDGWPTNIYKWASAPAGTTPDPAKKQATPQQVQQYGKLQDEIRGGLMRNDPNVMSKVSQFIQNAKGTHLEAFATQFLDGLKSSYPQLAKIGDPFKTAAPQGNTPPATPASTPSSSGLTDSKGNPLTVGSKVRIVSNTGNVNQGEVLGIVNTANGPRAQITISSIPNSRFAMSQQEISSRPDRLVVENPSATPTGNTAQPTAAPTTSPAATAPKSTATPQSRVRVNPPKPTWAAAPDDVTIPPVPGTYNGPPTSASAPDDLTIPRPPGSPAPLQVPQFLQRQGNASVPTSATAPDDMTIPHVPGTEPRATAQVPRFLQRQYNSNVTPGTSMAPRTARLSMPPSLAAQRNGPGEATPVERPETPPIRTRAFGGSDIPTKPFGRKGTTESRLTEDRWWVLAAVDNMLRTTQRGTPAREQTLSILHSMKQDPNVATKIPQLVPIQTESRDKVFDLAIYLVENDIHTKRDLMTAYSRVILEAVELQRSQIDQIFLGLARNLSASGQARTMLHGAQQQQAQGHGGRGRQTQTHHGPLSSHVDAASIMRQRITPEIMQRVRNDPHVQPDPSPHDWDLLMRAVPNGGATIAQVMQRLRETNPAIMAALLYAAEYAT